MKLGSIVMVRYRDHTLFRNTDSSLFHPAIRECVGWVEKESDEALWVLWDKSVRLLPYERVQTKESGLVLLKSDIMEIKMIA